MGTGYGLAQQINKIIQKHLLKFIRVIRLGPRFFIALGEKKQQKCVLKINLYERTISQDCRTHNVHLAKEIYFLEYLNKQNKYPFIKKSVPQIIDSRPTSERVWYLKSYDEGKFQNLRQSNFLYQKNFFNETNLNWVVKFFSELHQLSLTAPKSFKKIFHHHQLKDYLNLINGQRVRKILGRQLNDIYRFLMKRQSIFDHNQKALTHFEPYPVHFIKKAKGFVIIDWENVGWGNSAHDLGVVWLRAFTHKNWRDQLAKKFALSTPLKNHWWELFKVEIVVQAMANLPYLSGTTDSDEKKRAKKIISFMKQQIDLIVKDRFYHDR